MNSPEASTRTGAATHVDRSTAGLVLLRSCLGLLLALLCLPCTGALPSAPRLLALNHLGDRVEVVVEVPVGAERLVLESCRRGDLRGWTPRARYHVEAAGQVRFTVPASVLAGMELFRVRADEHDPLPASFYSGQSEFVGELLGTSSEPVTSWIGNSGVLSLSTLFGGASAIGSDASLGVAGQDPRAVVESDIWKLRGDRLYFFNASRGLQIIDVADPSATMLRATLPLAGQGEAMYTLGDEHVILLVRNTCGPELGNSGVIIVRVAADQPAEIARLPIKGQIVETRLVGSVLYVATTCWEPRNDGTDSWEDATRVASFDLALPAAPVARAELKRPGGGTTVAATDTCFFLATTAGERSWWDATLHVFDITDPAGAIVPRVEIPLGGRLNDKFKIHQRGDLLTVITEGVEPTNGTRRTELATYRLLPPAGDAPRWTRLGSLELARGESLFATRFDGDRAYIVTYRQVDPLWVVDFSDPATPTIKGELQIPGWSTYIHPMGDRLLTVGIDDTGGNRRVAVQLFDVADAAAPRLLSKVMPGDGWSDSEATYDEKALGVFPEDGLVLLPFSGWHTNGYVQGMQFIDLGRDQLQARGRIESAEVTPRRSLIREGQILAVTSRELLTVDATDRDLPVVRHRLELGYPVYRILPVGEWLLEFSANELRVTPAANPGPAFGRHAMHGMAVIGATVAGNDIHVLEVTALNAQAGPWVGGNLIGWTELTANSALRHTIFDGARLPELVVTGSCEVETRNYGSGDAEPLWVRPDLLIWSMRRQGYAFNRWTHLPMFRAVPGGQVPVVTPAVIGFPFYGFGPGIGWSGEGLSLFAFDVADPRAPRLVSNLKSQQDASQLSRTFTADGLVYYSHSTHESEVARTNSLVWTNRVWVNVTIMAWQTNIVSWPVPVIETHRTRVTNQFDAVKLAWPGPVDGSRLGAGSWHSLGLAANGQVLAWGNNYSGAVKPGGELLVAEPWPISLPAMAMNMAASSWQSFAVDAAGAVWEWGSPAGPLPPLPGQPPAEPSPPQIVPLSERIANLAAGHRHALALTPDGRLWVWGDNSHGQLGLGHRDPVSAPQSPAGPRFAAVSGGAFHSLALGLNGEVYSWGRNDFGQLGRDGSLETPLPVTALAGLRCRAVMAGTFHSLALTEDGQVWAWGHNQYSQLGWYDPHPQLIPRPVPDLPAVRELAAGGAQSLALAADGTLWQLGGDGASEGMNLSRIEVPASITTLAAGRQHAVALATDGSLYTWGSVGLVSAPAGELLTLRITGDRTTVLTRVEHELRTNLVLLPQIQPVMHEEVVTNYWPEYRHWRRHLLNVVDYGQDPASPVIRELASLPGTLHGLSHDGALLYARVTEMSEATPDVVQGRISALAYDGVAARHVAELLLSTNQNADLIQTAIDSSGMVVVTRSTGGDNPSYELTTWRLNSAAHFDQLGRLALASAPYELQLRDRIALLRSSEELSLVDVAQPAAPVLLPPQADLGCQWYDFTKTVGSRAQGLWVSAGEAGSLLIWRP